MRSQGSGYGCVRSGAAMSALMLMTGLAGVASAQVAPGQARTTQARSVSAKSYDWHIEVYGGAMFGTSPVKGTPLAQFSVGTPITMPSGHPSRRVSSWYFGDGAALDGSDSGVHLCHHRDRPTR
jgi:hypothetical protein